MSCLLSYIPTTDSRISWPLSNALVTLVRLGPDGVELAGRTLLITEAMLLMQQPLAYTCTAQQQQQQPHGSRKVQSNITFTVGR